MRTRVYRLALLVAMLAALLPVTTAASAEDPRTGAAPEAQHSAPLSLSRLDVLVLLGGGIVSLGTGIALQRLTREPT